MRKMILRLLTAVCLLASVSVTASAETSYGKSDWSVTFTSEKKMVSNFKTSDLDEAIYGIQPGDNVIITLALKNEHETDTDWYMTNEVLYSLEDRSANSATGGGAYTYKLTYTDPAGEETTLFDSDTVGGEEKSGAGEGLHQATDALEDYFFLDTLKKGQSGKITLEVALDGDTQGNDYQNTLADLQMNFAVELNTTGTNTTPPGRQGEVVKTGDEMTMTPFITAACITGILLLLLTFYFYKENEKEKKNRSKVPLVLLLSFCIAASLGQEAFAAKNEETTYTVRLYAGAHGTVGGKEVLVYKNLKYGSPLPFSMRTASLEKGSKYYIQGIRESGKDNNTAASAEELAGDYKVTEDQDYVVAYGILGDSVAYTVRFEDEEGSTLAPEETYYGNVGDRPVVAFLYIDGYLPQAYNLTGTLKSNAAENIFTFVYTPISEEAAAAGAAAAEAAGGTTAPATGTPAADAADAGAAAPGAADAAAAGAAADVEGVQPDALQQIGDEETPLGNVGAEDGEEDNLKSMKDEQTPLGRGDFATMLWDIPTAGKIGILSVLVLLGAGVGYLYLRRKRKMSNAG